MGGGGRLLQLKMLVSHLSELILVDNFQYFWNQKLKPSINLQKISLILILDCPFCFSIQYGRKAVTVCYDANRSYVK